MRTGVGLSRGANCKEKNPMDSEHQPAPRYESYVLRLRWVEWDGRPTCQAMLKSVRTEEERFFADLESLFAFLSIQAEGKDSS